MLGCSVVLMVETIWWWRLQWQRIRSKGYGGVGRDGVVMVMESGEARRRMRTFWNFIIEILKD